MASGGGALFGDLPVDEQAAEQGVDHRRRLGQGIEQPGIAQAVAEHADQGGMQQACRQARTDAGAQARPPALELLLAEGNEVVDEVGVAFPRIAQFVGELAAQQQDGQEVALLLVAGQAGHEFHEEVAQVLQGMPGCGGVQPLGELLPARTDLVEHFVEQMALVLEVPVDRTPRHATGAGDLLEAGMGHAVAQKQLLGGGEDVFAGLFGISLGSTHIVF